VQVTEIEERRGLEKPTENLGAYDLLLRGRALFRRADRDANLDARALFERAIEADPSYAEAYVSLGWTYLADVLWGWTEWPHEAIEEAEAMAARAISLSPDNARARAFRADILRVQRRFQEAEIEVLRALELNPNDALSHAIHGSVLLYSGHPTDAIPNLERTLRLDPQDPNFASVDLALAYYLDDRAEDAVLLLTGSDRSPTEDPTRPAVLAAALAVLGRDDEARAAAETVRRIYPFFNARAFAEIAAGPHYAEKLIDGLNKAGLD
jgi:tetratricopeptide (TPR) repeat protein